MDCVGLDNIIIQLIHYLVPLVPMDRATVMRNAMNGLNVVREAKTNADRDFGFLQITWSYRMETSPPPYVSLDNRRRLTQAAYIPETTLQSLQLLPEPPASHISPVLAGLHHPPASPDTEEGEQDSEAEPSLAVVCGAVHALVNTCAAALTHCFTPQQVKQYQ